VTTLVETLVHVCRVDKNDIGIITPYRSQLAQITKALQRRKLDVEAHTVDKYQVDRRFLWNSPTLRRCDCISLYTLLRSLGS
jgi:AAA domain